MKKINLRIKFFWDCEGDTREFVISVSNKTTIEEVSEALMKIHKYLDTEDKTGTYENNGRNPETLITYACEEYGWRWEKMKFDVDLEFN